MSDVFIYAIKDKTSGMFLMEPQNNFLAPLGQNSKKYWNKSAAMAVATSKNRERDYLRNRRVTTISHPFGFSDEWKYGSVPIQYHEEFKRAEFVVATFKLVEVE